MPIVWRQTLQPGVEGIFRHRGRRVSTSKTTDELPSALTPEHPIEFGDKLYPEFKSRGFRQYMIARLNATSQEPKSREEQSSYNNYAQRAKDLGLLANADEPRFSGGELLEWFVANCLQREFSCPSYWSVTVEGLPNDYDVITYRGNEIGYIECKSGHLGNIDDSQIREFLKREMALSPAFSVFLADSVSRERLNAIGEKFVVQQGLYRYEVPGMMNTVIDLELEEYKNFIRIIPINCFLVSGERKLQTTIEEIFQFLTVVWERPMPFENVEVKEQFKAQL